MAADPPGCNESILQCSKIGNGAGDLRGVAASADIKVRNEQPCNSAGIPGCPVQPSTEQLAPEWLGPSRLPSLHLYGPIRPYTALYGRRQTQRNGRTCSYLSLQDNLPMV